MYDSGKQVVIITGGSSGIGRCTARLFATHGWNVGIIARGVAAMEATARDVRAQGGDVAIAEADVTDTVALGTAADGIIAQLGPVDVWINCAGTGIYGRFDDVRENEFQRVTDVTYHGTVNGTRIALRHMRARGQGSIVNVCSAIAFHGVPLLSSYAGAKGAVRAFTQAIRGELRLEKSHVRICSVFPAAMNTPFFSHALSHMGWPARPAKPIYQPEVAAEGIWLASRGNHSELFITGTTELFSLATRFMPGVIGWCVSQLGMERQLTRDQRAVELCEPTLFHPSDRVRGGRGPFNHQARGWSLQVWMLGMRLKIFARIKRILRMKPEG
ncbi:SDR family oxidoreductase [Novacetimonas hansenii]|uniref:SDR family oxidoreductase n=1 Tax=Novacetimonas hansenii TaxID=436 RepID=A0AAW5EQC5_NOVHA|nr:SDR family oxidoreductase [Novacetimonas hansenii]MCJ8354003.1 SDR family oxidoreductase [Novacetimonas hansenii]